MITFEISKKISDLFNFITSYFNLNQTELLISWRKQGVNCPSYFVHIDEEKTSISIDIDDLPKDEKAAFSFFFNDLLKTNKNNWLECHIKEFCVQKLNLIAREISGHEEQISGYYETHIRHRRKGDPDARLPADFNDYLYNSCSEVAAYQYEVAFRNNIVPALKEKTGENFWDIKDLNRIVVMRDNLNGLQKTAMNYYIRFLQKDYHPNRNAIEKKQPVIDVSSLSEVQRKLYNFIRANGRCKDAGAYAYVYYHSQKIKEISGFDMYSETETSIVKLWRDKFKIGEYSVEDERRHHFPSTALDWYYKYLLSLKG